jgi:Response regulator containing CheY-like receiver, AAA-type ATPase, and DNA-binding domains
MGATILIVDDEPDVRTYLRTLFAKEGYNVVTAADGEEGLTVAREAVPDLVFIDIMMPKKTGIMLYRRLRKDPDLGGVPIVILTGLSQYRTFFAQDFEEVRQPEAFIEKPPDREQLLELVANLTGARKDG